MLIGDLRSCWLEYEKVMVGCCRELTRNSQPMRNKNRENTHQRKITARTRQYLRGSAICLRPRSCRDFTIIREKIQMQQYSFLVSQKLQLTNSNHQNSVFYILRTWFIMGYKTSKNNFQGRWPIKNHTTLFRSSQVVNRIKHN